MVGAVAGAAGGGGSLLASDVVGVASGVQEEFSSGTSYLAAAAIGAAGGAASAKPTVPRAAISGVGSNIRGHQTVLRLAGEVEGAVNQANRVLATGGTGATRWGSLYQRSTGWFGDSGITRMARGMAVQQIADDLLRNNTYMREAGVIFNRGSALGLRSPLGRLLRPDYQIPLSGGRWGIIDITTAGQAGKIFNYRHPASPFLVNVTHGFR